MRLKAKVLFYVLKISFNGLTVSPFFNIITSVKCHKLFNASACTRLTHTMPGATPLTMALQRATTERFMQMQPMHLAPLNKQKHYQHQHQQQQQLRHQLRTSSSRSCIGSSRHWMQNAEMQDNALNSLCERAAAATHIKNSLWNLSKCTKLHIKQVS